MTATQVNIDLFRNERREFSGQCLDELGVPIDITDATFASSAKSQAGDASVIASATITKSIPEQGVFLIEWNGEDFASYGSVFNECRLAYDLKVDDDNIMYGQIVLKPGVTA